MAGSFFFLSAQSQRQMLLKIKALWEEIDMAKKHRDDPELGPVLTNNIEFAKEEIQKLENILAASVTYFEVNKALGTIILTP